MRTLVVYESMYGNTHTVAQRIAAGLELHGAVQLVPVAEATAARVAWADLVVVGGPTHVHGLTSARSRDGAREAAEQPDADLQLDPDAEGPGVRDWFAGLEPVHGTRAAAFDTRFDGPPLLTGRAAHGIARRLRGHGFSVVGEPESFLVDKQNHLLDGEAERAARWAGDLGQTMETVGSAPAPRGQHTS